MRRRSSTVPFQLFSFQDIITSVMGIVVLILLVLALELSQRQFRSPAAAHAVVLQNTSETLEEVEAEIQRLRGMLSSTAIGELASISPTDVESRTASAADALERLGKEENETQRRLAKLEEQLRREQRELELLAKSARIGERQREIRELDRELQQWQGKKRIVYRTSANDGKQAWLVELDAKQFLVARAGKVEPPLRFDQPEIGDRRDALLAWSRKLRPESDSLHFLVKPGATNAFVKMQLALRARRFALGFDLLPSDQTTIDPETGASVDPNP